MEYISREYEEKYLRFADDNEAQCSNMEHCVGVVWFHRTCLPVFRSPRGLLYNHLCLICIRESVFLNFMRASHGNTGSLYIIHPWLNNLDDYAHTDFLVPLYSNLANSRNFTGITGPFVRLPCSKYYTVGNVIKQQSTRAIDRGVTFSIDNECLNPDVYYNSQRFPGVYDASYVIQSSSLYCSLKISNSVNGLNLNIQKINSSLNGKYVSKAITPWEEHLRENHIKNRWGWETRHQTYHPVLALRQSIVFFLENDATLLDFTRSIYNDIDVFINHVKMGNFNYNLDLAVDIWDNAAHLSSLKHMFSDREIVLPFNLAAPLSFVFYYCPSCDVIKGLPSNRKRHRVSKKQQRKQGHSKGIVANGLYWNYMTNQYHCYRKRSPGQVAAHRFVQNPSTRGAYHCNTVCKVRKSGRSIVHLNFNAYVSCIKCSCVVEYDFKWIYRNNCCEWCYKCQLKETITCSYCGFVVPAKQKNSKWIFCRIIMDGGCSPFTERWICGKHKTLSYLADKPFISNLIFTSIVADQSLS